MQLVNLRAYHAVYIVKTTSQKGFWHAPGSKRYTHALINVWTIT